MLFIVRGVPDWLESVRARSFAIIVVSILLGAQSVYGQRKDEPAQKTNEKIQQLASLARTRSVDATVGAGDLLHIDVFDVPELSRDVRVSDTGDIGYPLIPGKIAAAGQTPFQLESTLEQLLVENGLVSHPQVSVFVKEQVSQPITVVGAVNRPMVYRIAPAYKLCPGDAGRCGGITDTAGNIVTITRSRGPGTEPSAAKSYSKPVMNDVRASTADPPLDPAPDAPVITIQLQDLLESGNAAFNIPVYGGDVISVPPRGHHLRNGRRSFPARRIRCAGARTTNHRAQGNSSGAWPQWLCQGEFRRDLQKKSGDRSKRSYTGSRQGNRA